MRQTVEKIYHVLGLEESVLWKWLYYPKQWIVFGAIPIKSTNYQWHFSRIRKILQFVLVHRVKAMVFPAVMYRCQNWTIKKAEHQIIDAFELWCWRRFLRVPWKLRRSNQSILKEINPEYSLEELMLKFQYSDHLMQRADSLEKSLMLGKIEGKRRKGQQRMRCL